MPRENTSLFAANAGSVSLPILKRCESSRDEAAFDEASVVHHAAESNAETKLNAPGGDCNQVPLPVRMTPRRLGLFPIARCDDP
jgi:hypothetical protein